MKPKYTLDKEPMPLQQLDKELQCINPVCLDILYRRGYTTSEEVRDILFPSLKEALQPLTCKDIKAALHALADAIRKKQTIVVYRDYDVDGITAGALAVETLGALGAKVHHYVNERSIDGFGICKNGIDNILKRWPETQLILTVDNGIAGIEAIDYANNRGLTVVVTDHHEPGDILPNAAAVVDLKRKDEPYSFHDLCGCGLIFRVMLDLYREMKQDITPVLNTLDLVALATVADVVPLLGENRAFVQEGMKLIESGQRTFFRVMMRLYEVTELTAHYTLGFQFAPTLNSLSRMDKDTDLAVEALISNDDTWVELQAVSFRSINQDRKAKTQEQYELALSMIDPNHLEPAIVLYSDEFDEGIVGIIAGRLKEEFWKPTIILASDKDGNMKGSGRSINEFDLKGNLDKCSSLLTSYGGHLKAAGLSLPAENFLKFRKQFIALAAEELEGKEIVNEVPLAALLTEDTLTESLVSDLRILEPYGEGFPEPLFGLIARPDGVRYMGTESQHVKLTCSASNLSIIGWNKAQAFRGRKTLPCKFIGKPSLNVWRGNTSVQFIQAN